MNDVSDMKNPPDSRWLQLFRFAGYPPCWKSGLPQKEIRAWADYTCEDCGDDDRPDSLHVHHLTWKAKNDCRWQNLVALCCPCHTKLHNRGWQPGEAWNLDKWGDVPLWAIARNLLDEQGNPNELTITNGRATAVA